MKNARAAYGGAIHSAVEENGMRAWWMAAGSMSKRRLAAALRVPGTILALGLNYADHAKELAINARRRSRWSS